MIKGVVAVAGFSMGQADVLRNAMSKKIATSWRSRKTCSWRSPEEQHLGRGAATIWSRSSRSPGTPSTKPTPPATPCWYQTAYLKTHYPVEYDGALHLLRGRHGQDRSLTLAECKRLGVQVLPPSINRSQLQFSVEPLRSAGALSSPPTVPGPLAMRFGLIGVKNVGEGAIQSMIEREEKNGPFRSLADFCRRVDMKAINKRGSSRAWSNVGPWTSWASGRNC